MRRMRMTSVAALVAGAALMGAPTGASATGTGPVAVTSTTMTATTTNPVWTVLSSGGPRTGSCGSLRYSGSIAANGDVNVGAGSSISVGCTFMGVTVAVVQQAFWAGTIQHLDDGAGQVSAFTLTYPRPSSPAAGLRYRISSSVCSFDVGGGSLGEYVVSPAVGHRTSVTVPSWATATLAPMQLGMTVSNVSGLGCMAAGIANGQSASFAATFALSPGVAVAGV